MVRVYQTVFWLPDSAYSATAFGVSSTGINPRLIHRSWFTLRREHALFWAACGCHRGLSSLLFYVNRPFRTARVICEFEFVLHAPCRRGEETRHAATALSALSQQTLSFDPRVAPVLTLLLRMDSESRKLRNDVHVNFFETWCIASFCVRCT